MNMEGHSEMDQKSIQRPLKRGQDTLKRIRKASGGP